MNKNKRQKRNRYHLDNNNLVSAVTPTIKPWEEK
jgi:hypothetical protein